MHFVVYGSGEPHVAKLGQINKLSLRRFLNLTTQSAWQPNCRRVDDVA